MQALKKFRLVYLADAMLGLLILCGVGIYAALPWVLDAYIKYSYTDKGIAVLLPEIYNAMLTILYFSGIPAIALLVFAFVITMNITRNKPFIMQNARSLNWMGLCAVIISIVFFIGSFFLLSVFPIIICVIFLLLAVLAKVFAELFRTAVLYKEENDLTI